MLGLKLEMARVARAAGRLAGELPHPICKLVNHGLSLLQIESAKAFGEPAVDSRAAERRDELARLHSADEAMSVRAVRAVV
jgi:hypothetical protein